MIEFEHTIFQLLILVGLLNARPPRYQYTPYIIAVGILLAFVPPASPLLIPWDLLLGLTLPLLFWQNARWIINADWRGKRIDLILWAGAAILFGTMLTMTHALALSGAILFGLIAASMIWRSGESEEASSFISQISPLTLVFLLSEVNPSSKPPRVTWAASSVVFRLARRLPWAQYSSAKKPPRICAVGLPLGRYIWPMDLLP